MRSATAVLAAVLAGGLVLVLALGVTRGSALVYTLGVQPQSAVATLGPGGRVCQAPLLLPDGARFERVGIYAAGPGELELTVENDRTGAELARAVVTSLPPAGAPPERTNANVGGAVRAENPIRVCLRNAGGGSIELWGTADIASAATSATVNGEPLGQDVAILFEAGEQRSLLALLPEMAERASLFRARWLSPVAYGAVALLVLLGVPALLLRALRTAAD